MPIDIDGLDETELIDLNHRIVARLRVLGELRAHRGMLQFRIGDRVAFQPPGEGVIEGTLAKYNRKTVTVVVADGRIWRVSPNYLMRVVASASDSPPGTLLPGNGNPPKG
jgi:NADPH-dependent 2,4-dienoyl-CoA reductase/sulfur reductase-like enzyme